MLIHNQAGRYSFLLGIDPYSCGVIADDGFEVVHVNLASPLPWRAGMDTVAAYLESVGEARRSLCGVELRCPAPYSMDGFIAFNQDYCRVLQAWGLYVDDHNPLARTNIAPLGSPADMPQQLVAFSYATPSVNGRLKKFGYKTALVKNIEGMIYVMIVDKERVDLFQEYINNSNQKILDWLDEK